jgi:hypothetical protein
MPIFPHIISMGKAPFFLEIIDISKKKGALPIEIIPYPIRGIAPNKT